MIDKVINTDSKLSNSSAVKSFYEIIVPAGAGRIVETIFPEEGIYFGNDHDIGSLLKGAGFVVNAIKN
jgi:hypothetical protein